MRTLFGSVPTALFQPLAAQGAPVYSQVLLTLFDETQRHNLPLSRDLAVALVAEILTDPEAMAVTAETVDDIAGESVNDGRGRASAILRYLVRSGWLREEVSGDFARSYILPDYSFRLLSTIAEIVRRDAPPLQGLILAIHDLLFATLRDGNAHLRIPEAHRQTQILVNHLKELQHNIGTHLEQVVQEVKASAVLTQLFSVYREEVMARAYHLLRTTDHVGRFRPGVLQAINDLEQRNGWAGEQVGSDGANEHGTPLSLGERLEAIRDYFDAVDSLLAAIDRRHGEYMGAALRAIERDLTASATTSGQIHMLLEQVLSGTGTEDHARVLDDLVSLYRLEWVDESSLSRPGRAPRPFVPDEDAPALPSRSEIEQARDRTREQLRRAASRQRIKEWALALLAGRAEARASELPLAGADDLALVIYLREYGDGKLGYRVVEIEGSPWVELAQVGFHDFTILVVEQPE